MTTLDFDNITLKEQAHINALRSEIGRGFEKEVFNTPAPKALLKGFLGSEIQRTIQHHHIVSGLNLSGTIFGLFHGNEGDALSEYAGLANHEIDPEIHERQTSWFIGELEEVADRPNRDPFSVIEGGDFDPQPEIVDATEEHGILQFSEWQEDHSEWFIIDPAFRCFLESCGYAIGDFQGETLGTKPNGWDTITRRVRLDSTALLYQERAQDFDLAVADPRLETLNRAVKFGHWIDEHNAQEFLYEEELTAHQRAAFMTGYPTEQCQS